MLGAGGIALKAASVSFAAAVKTFQATGFGKPMARWLVNSLRRWAHGGNARADDSDAQACAAKAGRLAGEEAWNGPRCRRPGE